jgi:hypothetical protein
MRPEFSDLKNASNFSFWMKALFVTEEANLVHFG